MARHLAGFQYVSFSFQHKLQLEFLFKRWREKQVKHAKTKKAIPLFMFVHNVMMFKLKLAGESVGGQKRKPSCCSSLCTLLGYSLLPKRQLVSVILLQSRP